MIKPEKALSLIRTEYLKLDELTRSDTKNIELKISGRLKRNLGYFRVLDAPSARLQIVLSRSALRSYDLMYEVCRHEYAHAIVYMRDPGKNHMHDSVWKAAAREVGCIPRASIRADRLIDFDQLSMDLESSRGESDKPAEQAAKDKPEERSGQYDSAGQAEKPAAAGNEKTYYVYMLECADGSLYTGISTDPKRRLNEHKRSARGAKYTKARKAIAIVYTEEAENRSEAARREYEIKQLTRAEKLELIFNSSNYSEN